ncbi:hypothetical protein P775_25885 [Puniceibacterium antarcticum]|uniref:Uncharacterized protein n=1 Tax=Puniceibacterium antarcticum TaxID=1206336 RepID=A0A2G8R241_9RHOB|nr:hypothetical protein P775_25885 [Puniceibacterium antarcticum]
MPPFATVTPQHTGAEHGVTQLSDDFNVMIRAPGLDAVGLDLYRAASRAAPSESGTL